MTRRSKKLQKQVSLKSIAKKLDVSISTISRALNNDPGVSPQKAEYIKKIAHKMGYRPKPLRRSVTKTIGLLIENPKSTPVSGHMQRIVYEIENYASRSGYYVHIQSIYCRSGKYELPEMLRENRVDGVLLLGDVAPEFCAMLQKNKIPVAFISDLVERTGVSSIIADPTEAIDEAFLRLSEMGHKTMGLCISRIRYPTVHNRYEVSLAACKKFNFRCDKAWIQVNLDDGLRGGQVYVERILSLSECPTALLFCSDGMALGGYFALLRNGVLIPDDISVLAFGNAGFTSQLTPALTTVDDCIPQLAAGIIDQLISEIKGKNNHPKELKISSDLLWRESCAPLFKITD